MATSATTTTGMPMMAAMTDGCITELLLVCAVSAAGEVCREGGPGMRDDTSSGVVVDVVITVVITTVGGAVTKEVTMEEKALEGMPTVSTDVGAAEDRGTRETGGMLAGADVGAAGGVGV